MAGPIYEIGLMARVRIDAHSLNNEGSIGNVIEPRTVVLASGEKTDGISGEMLKHIHSKNVWRLATESNDHLCKACKVLEPTRAGLESEVTGAKKDDDALDNSLKCAVCDIHGFLVEKPTINRKSTVEFGWAIAIPSTMQRSIHVHTRVAPGEKGKVAGEAPTQMVYNRPTRSGCYGIVSVFQPWRLGLNEITYEYAEKGSHRKSRFTIAMEAYQALFTQLEGAMTSTRLPHVSDVQGAFTVSNRVFPAVVTSPLDDGYRDTAQKITKDLGLQYIEFNNINEALSKMNELKEKEIFTLTVKK